MRSQPPYHLQENTELQTPAMFRTHIVSKIVEHLTQAIKMLLKGTQTPLSEPNIRLICLKLRTIPTKAVSVKAM